MRHSNFSDSDRLALQHLVQRVIDATTYARRVLIENIGETEIPNLEEEQAKCQKIVDEVLSHPLYNRRGAKSELRKLLPKSRLDSLFFSPEWKERQKLLWQRYN